MSIGVPTRTPSSGVTTALPPPSTGTSRSLLQAEPPEHAMPALKSIGNLPSASCSVIGLHHYSLINILTKNREKPEYKLMPYRQFSACHRLSNLVRIALLLGSFLLYTNFSCEAADLVQMGSNNLGFTPERLRDFIQNPPNIDNCVFKRTLHLPPVVFTNQDDAKSYLKNLAAGKTNIPAAVEIFQLRYKDQPRAFLFREIASLEEHYINTAPRRKTFVGRYDTNWWSIDERSVVELKSHTGRSTNAQHRVSALYQNYYLMASEILRLGMFELNPATFELIGGNNNAFTGYSDQLEKINGLLTTNSLGVVTSIEYNIINKPGIKRVQFTYSKQNAVLLPKQIEIYYTNPANGTSVAKLYCAFTLLDYNTNAISLESVLFSPRTYASTNDIWLELVDGEYFMDEGGTNRVHIKSGENNSTLNSFSTQMILLLFVTAAVITLVLSTIKYLQKRSRLNQ